MRLTLQDKNTILKATLRASTPEHFESFRQWVVNLVEASDAAEVTEGRADTSVQVPQYAPPPAGNGHARVSPSRLENSLL